MGTTRHRIPARKAKAGSSLQRNPQLDHLFRRLDGVERGPFPEVVAADPEGQAVVQRGVEPDAADAAFLLPAVGERRRINVLCRLVGQLGARKPPQGPPGGGPGNRPPTPPLDPTPLATSPPPP